jgi:HemY protein
MLTILWFLLVAFLLTTSFVWLLDHNGNVIVTWLGYQVQTDMLTAILLAVFFSLTTFIISYFLARLLAIRFPALLRLLFKRSYTRSLERLVLKHRRGFDATTELLLALEIGDKKSTDVLQKKFEKLIRHIGLNDFFRGKILFDKQQFSKSAEIFEKFTNNPHAKILVLRSKFELSLQDQDGVRAIAYAKQILSVQRDNFEIAKQLFILYKKCGLWQDAKTLIREYGSEKFRDELQKRDVAVINTALALEAYQQKKFLLAIKHTNIALKAEINFLPALEIRLKSWLKLGLGFKVSWEIKSLWKDNPHLILAEIFDLVNRKSSAKTRIKMMKNLVEANGQSALGKIAIGIVAFRAGDYATAKEFLILSSLQQKTYRVYKLLAATEKALGNEIEAKKNSAKRDMFECDDHYRCSSCGHLSSRWNAKCSSCDSYDSIEWNR